MERHVLKQTAIFILAIFFFALPAGADIKEGQLEQYKSAFREKVISDNPGSEAEIKKCLNGMIKEGGAGVRLIDKFGLFLYDSSRGSILLERVRFISDGTKAIFIVILKDGEDGQAYSLYLEYIYNSSKGTYTLGDIYFSRIFEERMDSVREFFGGD